MCIVCRYFAFDLLAGTEIDECGIDQLLSGYMSVVVEFKDPVTTPHVMACYSYSSSSFDIDKDSNVRISKPVI